MKHKPNCYIYKHGLLFAGKTIEECEAQVKDFENPKPVAEPYQPKKKRR